MVEVCGNIENVQSSVDFYLNITSKEEVLDSRFMRDRFFEIFRKEESYRKDNFLVYQEVISDNYRIDRSVEPELVDGEIEYDGSCSYFSSSDMADDSYPDDKDVIANNLEIERLNSDNEIKSSYPEDMKSENESIDEDDFIVYGDEDDEGDSKEDCGSWGDDGSSDDEENTNKDWSDWGDDDNSDDVDDFLNWGSGEDDIEDLGEKGTSSEDDRSEDDNLSNWDNDVNDFSNWGNDGEDDFSSWSTEENPDSLEGGGTSNFSDDTKDWLTDTEEDNFSSWSDSGEKSSEVKSVSVDETPSEVPKDDKNLFGEELGVFEGVFEETDKSETPKNVVVNTSIKSSAEITSVPSDLRDFIKLYPNCELSLVYKYFPKKEVEKQLRLGRVFKRKNKLLI